ncbi:hypothetical protein GTC6_05517 [Gordonia terrae C-6]|uniref:Helicase HerA central domain-containing protein n=1 Tax=Gordonia terrae C-6 TaxID=1316928 RepID=R7YCN6_9ACTN|nr:DUF87 domain-containing protein [Gordonia terrae]EON33800.1 hypothetical protein GTC6_05517 [Gordonia terrae C-6]
MEVAIALSLIAAPLLVVLGAVFTMRTNKQREYDRDHRTIYKIVFPHDVPVDRAAAMISTLPASIKPSKGSLSVPTMVFETINTGGVFSFRVRVPSAHAEYVVGQLRSAIPGIAVEPVGAEKSSLGEFNAGYDLGMTLPDRQIEVANKPADFAVSLLNSMSPIGDEVLVYQWVVAGTNKLKLPEDDERVQSTDFSWRKALLGKTEASRDEKSSRRAKVATEPNFLAALRIAARSQHPDRSKALCHNTIMALKASDGVKVKFQYREVSAGLTSMMNEAWTPISPHLQLSVSELVPRLGWALGSDFVEGVARASFRHLPAGPEVPEDGIVVGVSSLTGRERRVALPAGDGLTKHLLIAGATGVGKTFLAQNILIQHISRGGGAIIMERDGDLMSGTLSRIHRSFFDRVVVVDATDLVNFVGINPFDFESPMVIAAKLADLFERIYKINGVNLRKILFHGIPALAETGDATLLDLIPLVDPKTPADVRWSRDRISRLESKELIQFFKDWNAKSADRRSKDMEPVLNRFWELTLDPQVSRMLNHSHSTIDLGAALRDNKIVCINLKGVDSRLAEVIGSLLASWIWGQAASNAPAEHDNLLFLDEAHLFSHLETTINDMLATARKRKLGVVMATQFVEKLPVSVQQELSTNARTKIVMQSGPNSAQTLSREFASREVNAAMIQNLEKYTAIARLVLPGGGTSTPITIRTLDAPPVISDPNAAVELSNRKFARSAAQVDADQKARRHVASKGKQRPDIGDEPVLGDWKDDF